MSHHNPFAFPTPSGDGGMGLREYLAAHVDVAVYEPKQLYSAVQGHEPTVSELADFMAFLRLAEADAIMRRLGL